MSIWPLNTLLEDAQTLISSYTYLITEDDVVAVVQDTIGSYTLFGVCLPDYMVNKL